MPTYTVSVIHFHVCMYVCMYICTHGAVCVSGCIRIRYQARDMWECLPICAVTLPSTYLCVSFGAPLSLVLKCDIHHYPVCFTSPISLSLSLSLSHTLTCSLAHSLLLSLALSLEFAIRLVTAALHPRIKAIFYYSSLTLLLAVLIGR